MTGILAIDTSADACSVSISIPGRESVERYEVVPRRHNQVIFDMLQDLVPGGDLRARGVDCLAYSAGPGSFTGLRIAASAVQGLAFSNGLPVVGVSTLAVLAQCALEDGLADASERVLSLIDARVGEVYCGIYAYEERVAVERTAPWVTSPGDLSLPDDEPLRAVGDGLRYREDFPQQTAQILQVAEGAVESMPRARGVVALARAKYDRGECGAASDVQPVYVRDEISWKKLAEQGKQ